MSELTFGEFAHHVIQQHYGRMVKQEAGVLADHDPESLHQMRVSSRRLRAALHLLDGAIALPKAARERRLRAVTRMLGSLRDLDVQLAALKTTYYPQLQRSEQKPLGKAIATLEHHRRHAFESVSYGLQQTRYLALKAAYRDWLETPCYTLLAQMPLLPILPDLLSSSLGQWLLHPGWLVETQDLSQASLLHDLRKVCKQMRYQTEFLGRFYGPAFQEWSADLRQMQEQLGTVQDGVVLQDTLKDVGLKLSALPQLVQRLRDEQAEALARWETLRQNYLQPERRARLHRLILETEPLNQINQATEPALRN